MVEQKRTQLFMLLVQQTGVGSLPLSHLSGEQFLEYLRKAEIAVAGCSPMIVYWSSRDASWLLPESKALAPGFSVFAFSEQRPDKQEEYLMLVESQELSLVLYCHNSEEDGKNIYQCVGSVDPEMVRQAFQMMLPVWQFLDLGEANRLEDIRHSAVVPATSASMKENSRAAWIVNKNPPARSGAPATVLDPGRYTGEFLPVAFSAPEPLTRSDNTVAGSTGRAAGVQVRDEFLEVMAPESGEQLVETAIASAPLTAMVALPQPIYTSTEESKKNKKSATGLPVLPVSAEFQSLESLRNAWTSIAEDSRVIFPPYAQSIIRDILWQLRHSEDHSSILQLGLEELTRVAQADRGLIWQLHSGQLVVTHEYSVDGNTPFLHERLDATESSNVTYEFFSRFPDDSGVGVIAIGDTKTDSIKEYKNTPALRSFLELGGVKARLIAQLRCVGKVHGFLELQQSAKRQWSEQDAALLQSVAETLSIVVQQSVDTRRREMDAGQMKLINTISELFRESEGQRSKDTLSRSVKLVAEHMGFLHGQIFLLNEEEGVLVPQISGGGDGVEQSLGLADSANPFVQACQPNSKVRLINLEYTRKGDPFFGHDMAIVAPLESEGEMLGVLGLWGRQVEAREIRAVEDRELARIICNNLASIIRAEQAIAQIRADRAREQLINRVTQTIRNSPKEVDQILETLVEALCEQLNLGLCVVSLFDGSNSSFVKSKVSGPLSLPEELPAHHFAEELFHSVLPEINAIPILSAGEIYMRMQAAGKPAPAEARMATIVPLIHHDNLKAALCLVSCDNRPRFSVQDMKMIQALAERVAVDIAHKELFEQVERQAVTDPMTGLHNRRYFSEQFSREMDRYQRFGHPFSYIILDLDYLKKINDSLGHQFGDQAIKHIASVAKKCVRDVDTTARYGGEEFVVLLPETDVAGARVVAERMCAAIAEQAVEGVGTVTASIGVATFPYDASERDKLTELADQALYLAKHRGRNQVCSVSEDLLPTLTERGEEALEVQQATFKAKVQELGSIDLKLISEHGLLGILGAVIKMIEAKDAYSADRSPRAAEYAVKLASTLHLSKEHTTIISLSAILHNIGKIAVSEELLQKKGPLTQDERKTLQNIPSISARILEPAKHLHRVASVVEACHEHWDGSGYPKGLQGEAIPLESRIISLIDSYVAMTSNRPYRQALSPADAQATLHQGAGKQWDPRLVKLFLSVLAKEAKAH